MNSSELAELRRWAESLRNHERSELRAAARAILLLADEVGSLRAEVDRRKGSDDLATGPDVEPELDSGLRQRFTLRRDRIR